MSRIIKAVFPVILLIAVIACGACAQTTSTAKASPVVKKVLDNGLTVVIKPEPGSGLVAVVALVRAGAAQESIQTAGIGDFVSHLLLAGTRLKSAEEVASIADEVGGNIGSQWQPDTTDIRVVTTSARFNDAMNLIGECLTEANFESKWVEQQRTALLSNIKSGSDDVFNRAYADLRQLLYEDNSYRRPYNSMERIITLATPQDLKTFFGRYYVPNNIVLSIVGDVAVDRAIDRAEKAFAGVPPAKLPIDRGVPDESLDRSKFHASEADLNVAYLMMGWLAPGIGSSDYPAAAVAANALGGGKGSIMFRELRQKQGMGYDLGTIYPRSKYQSHVLAYVVTDPFKSSLPTMTPSLVLEDIKKAILKEVDNLKSAPLSDEDLERAKGYTIGSYALTHQHMFDRAYILGWLEAVGIGCDFDTRFPDEIQKVTAADVQRAARKYFGNYAAVLLLPKSQSPAITKQDEPSAP